MWYRKLAVIYLSPCVFCGIGGGYYLGKMTYEMTRGYSFLENILCTTVGSVYGVFYGAIGGVFWPLMFKNDLYRLHNYMVNTISNIRNAGVVPKKTAPSTSIEPEQAPDKKEKHNELDEIGEDVGGVWESEYESDDEDVYEQMRLLEEEIDRKWMEADMKEYYRNKEVYDKFRSDSESIACQPESG